MNKSELDSELRLQERALIRHYLIPNLIRQAALTILSFFRVAMVSNLSPEAASALGSMDFINNIITSIGPAIGIGGLLVVANYYNHRDYEGTGRAAGIAQIIGCGFALLICLHYFFFRRGLIGLFFGAATEQVKVYMAEYAAFSSMDCMVSIMISMGFAIQNAVRITRPQSWLGIMQYSLTLLLSYVFINGGGIEIGAIRLRVPAMGISGAGLGSLTSSLISWLLLQVMLLRERQHFNLTKLANYRPNRRLVRDILKYGIPPAMENTAFNFSRLLTQSMVVLSGTINTAAITISNTVSGIYLIPTNAGNTSLTSLGSQAFGRNDFRSVKYYNRFFYLLTTCSQTVMAVVYLLIGSPILSLFTDHPDVISRAHQLMIIYVIVAPLIHHGSFGIPSLLRGLGDVRFVMRVSIFTSTVVRLFFSWLFAIQFNMQAMGVWLGMMVDWLVRSIIFTIRFYRRKWLPASAAADSPPDEAGGSDDSGTQYEISPDPYAEAEIEEEVKSINGSGERQS